MLQKTRNIPKFNGLHILSVPSAGNIWECRYKTFRSEFFTSLNKTFKDIFSLFSVIRRSRDRWTPLTMINGQLWNQVNHFPTPNVYRPCTGWGGEAHEENLLGGELGEQSPWEEQQRRGRRSEKSAWILDWSNKLDGSKYSWGKSKDWRILFATLILFLSYLWMEQHYKHVYIYMCVFANKLLFCNDISRFSC